MGFDMGFKEADAPFDLETTIYPVSERGMNRLNNDFTFHPPFGDQVSRYEAVRYEAKKFAQFLMELAPESRELSLALTNLDQVVFWTNAAIARNEKPEAELNV